MIDFIVRLAKKFRDRTFRRELIAYGLVGLLSTADNIFWCWLFYEPLGLYYLLANALGWFVDVWITFVMNKYLVFCSFKRGTFWRESWQFISARFGSGLLDMALLWIFVEFLKMDTTVGKGIDVVIVIIVNYITAKLWVFSKDKMNGGNACER
jgi:putative flippase GtrA